jgi:hypothetical protein
MLYPYEYLYEFIIVANISIHMALYTKGSDKQSQAMTPTGSGIIDVVNDFTWTLSNNKEEVPVAYVTEYQINSGQLLAGLYYYTKQSKDVIGSSISSLENLGQAIVRGPVTEDPYKFMYFATPTKFNYAFPWLGGDKFSRTNSFSEGDSHKGMSEIGKQAIGYGSRGSGKVKNTGFAKLTSGVRQTAAATATITEAGRLLAGVLGKVIPGNIGLNSSKSWNSTAGQGYTIEFDLINTFNDTNEIRKNRELAYLLTYQNSPFRRNFAVIDPVCIYQLSIPDVVHFPACYISSLNITNLGNTRSLILDGELRTIPEGYGFSITFESLIEESRNIFYGVENSSSRVQAISTQTAFEAIKKAGGDLLDKANSAIDSVMNDFSVE